jgi:hypothetical protein
MESESPPGPVSLADAVDQLQVAVGQIRGRPPALPPPDSFTKNFLLSWIGPSHATPKITNGGVSTFKIIIYYVNAAAAVSFFVIDTLSE